MGNGPVHFRQDAEHWARKNLHDHGELSAFGLRKSQAMETCLVLAADSTILKATTQQIQQQSHQRQSGHWAFAAGRHWQQAMDCFHQLCRSNEASHTSHTTTLSSCERAMRWEDALTLLLLWPFNSQSWEAHGAVVIC